ncbi:hypothetical protein MHAS44199_10080 [Mycolicibacterium hassiacum DSM 44199]|nr:hypothetical protein [Mycolicibacterium hassiacum DSM 44199]
MSSYLSFEGQMLANHFRACWALGKVFGLVGCSCGVRFGV